MQFRTRAIHVGQDRDPATGAVVPPIHVASTFVQPDATMATAYDYARTGSPRCCVTCWNHASLRSRPPTVTG